MATGNAPRGTSMDKAAAYARAVERWFATDGAALQPQETPRPLLRLRRCIKTAFIPGEKIDLSRATHPDAPAVVASAHAARSSLKRLPWFDFRRFHCGDETADMEEFGKEAVEAGVLRLPFDECVFVLPRYSLAEGQFTTIMQLQQFDRKVCNWHVMTVYADGSATVMPATKPYELGKGNGILFLLAAMSSKAAVITQRAIWTGLPPRSAADGDIYREVTVRLTDELGHVGGIGAPHASPRLHWRRGHIRRLPDKTTWVRPTLVGDGQHGTVIHDYVGAR